MRNTYNISLLRKRIVDALPRPASRFGESAIEGFLSLPGASAWRPERIGLRELSFVFDVGVPLALIGDNASLRPIALEIGDAARDGREPEGTVRSLVHAAALLSCWGSTVEFVSGASPGRRIWRIEIVLPSGEPIDVVMPAEETRDAMPAGRAQLLVRDVNGSLEDTAASFDEAFARSPTVCAALVFQPRFWIGVEQKEWLHLARLNTTAQFPIAADRLGGADGHRRALRLALLVSKATHTERDA